MPMTTSPVFCAIVVASFTCNLSILNMCCFYCLPLLLLLLVLKLMVDIDLFCLRPFCTTFKEFLKMFACTTASFYICAHTRTNYIHCSSHHSNVFQRTSLLCLLPYSLTTLAPLCVCCVFFFLSLSPQCQRFYYNHKLMLVFEFFFGVNTNSVAPYLS